MGLAGLVRDVVTLPISLARPVVGLAWDASRYAVQELTQPSKDSSEIDRSGADLAHRKRRVWRTTERAHIELREVPDHAAETYLSGITQALRSRPDVTSTTCLPGVARVVVGHTPGADVDELVTTVAEVESRFGFDNFGFGRHRPDHPADREPVVGDLITIGADLAGLGLATGARTLRVPAFPFEIDAAALLTIASYVPVLRGQIERRIDSPGVDVGFAVSRAIAGGLTQSFGGPVIDVLHRSSALVAHESRRRSWERLEPELALWHEGDHAAPLVPELRPGYLPDGPIERFGRPTTIASGAVAGLGLLTRPSLDRTLSFLVAGTPKAAKWGREAFAWHLGAHLADRNILVLDPGALERLDRIDTVVVASDLLVEPVGRGWRPAAFAPELIAEAREAGVDVWVATDHPDAVNGLEIRGTIEARAGAAEAVRRMQAQGRGVLAIAGGDDPLLRVADVAMGLRRPNEGLAWGASMIAGEDLVDGHLLVMAIGAARRASRQSAHIAMAGTGVAGLMALGGVIPGNLSRVMGAVNLTSLVSHANGARVATMLAREPLPEPIDPTPFHTMATEDVMTVIGVDPRGLDPMEADRRAAPSVRRTPAAVELARAVGDEAINPFTPFLAAGAGLSAAAGSASDAALVAGVVGLNALIGGAQRYRAERATRALMEQQRTTVTVVRAGQPQRIDTDVLVVGDIVTLEAGEIVPADCRLLEAHALEVDESSLTGESIPVLKDTHRCDIDAPVAERTSMLYAGTTVAAGSATAVVVAVGRQTEAYRGLLLAGRGAGAGGVEARLESLTTMVTPASVLAGLGVTASGLARGHPMVDVMSAGVSLAVAAVPEGLPLLATAAQQAAARRLSKQGVIVRNARGIEALGRVDVICADKTGTLTLGRIRVESVSDGRIAESPLDLTGGRRSVLAVAYAATPQPEPGRKLPHPTDRAILYATEEAGLAEGEDIPLGAPAGDLPFEPRRGYHARFERLPDADVIYVKGAPEVILPLCQWRVKKDGSRVVAKDKRKQKWVQEVEAMASRGLRILAVARRHSDDALEGDESDVDDLTFVGLVGLRDPVRATSAQAVADLEAAGVSTIMITGDHPVTARGIAAELGLPAEEILTGPEMDRMTDQEMMKHLEHVSVCARVTPAHKMRIVRALQANDHVVAMTGDGANDAPAIRLADVGIALGTRATDAARDASDLIVTDDRIETIVSAVTEGRSLWSSVRDATAILVGGNLGEIAFTLTGGLLTGTPPINTRQLLLVNLMTDVLPAMAIAVSRPADTTPEALLAEGPEASLGSELNRAIVERALTTALGTSAGWLAGRLTGRRKRASTVALASLVGTELGQTLAVGWRSPLVTASSLASMGILIGIVQTPGVSQAFGCTPLGPIGWSQAATSATLASLLGPRLPNTVTAPLARALARSAGEERGEDTGGERLPLDIGQPSTGIRVSKYSLPS